MKKNITFLTKRNFDVKLLIQNLKKNSASITDIKNNKSFELSEFQSSLSTNMDVLNLKK